MAAEPEPWNPVGEAGFTGSSVIRTALARQGDTLYFAFGDNARGNRATVLRHIRGGPGGWEPVGAPGITEGAAKDVQVAVDGGGRPVVAFVDNAHGNRVGVLRFEAGVWHPLGQPGRGAVSRGAASHLALAIWGGRPCLAFMEPSRGSAGGHVAVLAWDSLAWRGLGETGAPASAGPLCLAAGKSLHLAFCDARAGGRPRVLRWESGPGDGGTWRALAETGAGPTPVMALAVSGEHLYLAMADGRKGRKAVVFHHDGRAWRNPDPEPASADTVDYLALAAIPAAPGQEGQVLLAFNDRADGDGAKVMRLNRSAWESLGGAGSGNAEYLAMEAGEGSAYLAFGAFEDGCDNVNRAMVMRLDLSHGRHHPAPARPEPSARMRAGARAPRRAAAPAGAGLSGEALSER